MEPDGGGWMEGENREENVYSLPLRRKVFQHWKNYFRPIGKRDSNLQKTKENGKTSFLGKGFTPKQTPSKTSGKQHTNNEKKKTQWINMHFYKHLSPETVYNYDIKW